MEAVTRCLETASGSHFIKASCAIVLADVPLLGKPICAIGP